MRQEFAECNEPDDLVDVRSEFMTLCTSVLKLGMKADEVEETL
jgi:hypothetical protein